MQMLMLMSGLGAARTFIKDEKLDNYMWIHTKYTLEFDGFLKTYPHAACKSHQQKEQRKYFHRYRFTKMCYRINRLK